MIILSFFAGSPSCPRVSPVESIQEAINASQEGDVIRVASGIYKENITISSKKNLTLILKNKKVLKALIINLDLLKKQDSFIGLLYY